MTSTTVSVNATSTDSLIASSTVPSMNTDTSSLFGSSRTSPTDYSTTSYEESSMDSITTTQSSSTMIKTSTTERKDGATDQTSYFSSSVSNNVITTVQMQTLKMEPSSMKKDIRAEKLKCEDTNICKGITGKSPFCYLSEINNKCPKRCDMC